MISSNSMNMDQGAGGISPHTKFGSKQWAVSAAIIFGCLILGYIGYVYYHHRHPLASELTPEQRLSILQDLANSSSNSKTLTTNQTLSVLNTLAVPNKSDTPQTPPPSSTQAQNILSGLAK